MTMRCAGVSSAETDYGIMLLDEDSGRYWNLNPTAALVLRTLLDGGPDQAAHELAERSVEAATAGRDVRSCWTASARPAWWKARARHEHARDRLPPAPVGAAGRRAVAYAAVGAARLLATQPPRRIRAVLGQLRRGRRRLRARQGGPGHGGGGEPALRGPGGLRRPVAGHRAALPAGGQWPTWCVGARRMPPFGAHAWVEAEGGCGEDYLPDYFRTFFTVP